jgi:hypothetical protein
MDLDNLTQEDFIEMAKYVSYLEQQVEDLKGYCITLKTQRVSADNKVRQLQSMLSTVQNIQSTPTPIKLNDDITLVNPEQYREKKQF